MITTGDVARLLEKLVCKVGPLSLAPFGLTEREIEFYSFYLSQPVFLNDPDRHGQIGQDLWVALLLNCWDPVSPSHRDGYFVEFGAFDGLTHSNSALFEKRFGWKGVLVEPQPENYRKCQANRSCMVENKCVWTESGKSFSFNIVPNSPALATMEQFENGDNHTKDRLRHKQLISTETISLEDLLQQHQAPRVIDYISLDTEGSEFQILESFNFDRYDFKVLTVEHNRRPVREQLKGLLESKGFSRLERSIDYFDDLYLNTRYLP